MALQSLSCARARAHVAARMSQRARACVCVCVCVQVQDLYTHIYTESHLVSDRFWDMIHINTIHIIESLNKGGAPEACQITKTQLCHAVPRILIKGMMVACRSVFFTLAPWWIQRSARFVVQCLMS